MSLEVYFKLASDYITSKHAGEPLSCWKFPSTAFLEAGQDRLVAISTSTPFVEVFEECLDVPSSISYTFLRRIYKLYTFSFEGNVQNNHSATACFF